MTSQTRNMLVTALIFGVLGDYLVYQDAARLGFSIWTLGLVGASVFFLARAGGIGASATGERDERLVALSAISVVAVMLVTRAAEQLFAFSMLTAMACAGVTLWRARGGTLVGARAWELIDAGLNAAGTAVFGAPRLARGLGEADASTRRTAMLTFGGLIAAVPLVLITVNILAEGDPVFQRGVDAVGELLDTNLFAHGFTIAALTWLVSGWFGGLTRTDKVGPSRALVNLEFAALAPALFGFSAVLATYLGVQARVLFGGTDYVLETTGVSFASYARGGFFELVFVSGIAMGLLITSDAVIARDDEASRRKLRASGLILVMLVAVLAASALQRMGLYVGAYGWSVDRLYALAAMFGIIAAVIWFALTVLRGRGDRFFPGIFFGGIAWVLALHVVNPDATVSRANATRAATGAEFDLEYHAKLSADAIPALVRASPQLPAAVCADLLKRLEERWTAPEMRQGDWRLWNISTARARRAIDQAVAAGQAACTAP